MLDESKIDPAGVFRMTLMHDEDIKTGLARLKGWEVREGKLYREVQFGSFKVALRFMKDIENIAERGGACQVCFPRPLPHQAFGH